MGSSISCLLHAVKTDINEPLRLAKAEQNGTAEKRMVICTYVAIYSEAHKGIDTAHTPRLANVMHLIFVAPSSLTTVYFTTISDISTRVGDSLLIPIYEITNYQ